MSCFMQKENDSWLNIDPVLLDGFIQKNVYRNKISELR